MRASSLAACVHAPLLRTGNSGGPLLDSGGCLIGINTAIYSPSGANSGVGFAIPVDVVKSSVEQIIEHGRVVRPILGISFAPDQSSEQLGVKGEWPCFGLWGLGGAWALTVSLHELLPALWAAQLR